ncbi:EAL domain-containing protein [Cellulomonas sp. KRMCY2]|uniref:bifunctional diguanylate cyclase/phosphodiesterase n=1 Tax=Cellulomonas sp. KRMCY2 TaxID=1304865 RepID=UPI0018CC0F3E|nr:EAL domain-containing protein [Cellulomonas sp. KRMCY2]
MRPTAVGVRPQDDVAVVRPGSRPEARLEYPTHSRVLRRLSSSPVGLVVLAVAVFVLAYFAVALAPVDHRVAAWWPAAGVSVLAMVWAPRRWVLAVGLTIAISSGIANAVAGRPWDAAAGFGITNALEATVVAWWLVRGRVTPSMATLEDMFRLLAATFLGVLVMGLGAGLTVGLLEHGDALTAARTVMASHGAAIMVIAPLGLRASAPQAPGRGPEAVAQWAITLTVTAAVFSPGQALPLTFIPMPFLVWGALRLGMRTVAAQLVALAVVIVWASRYGGGPFAAELGSSTTTTASLVQGYLLVCSLIMLPLVVSVSQRRAALARVAASERLFRQGFSEALLGMLLLRRCVPGHDGGPQGHARAEVPDAPDHAGGGLDVVELNEVAARILTGMPDELVGASWTARLETGDRAMLADAVEAMAAGTMPGWHGEIAVQSWDGMRWVEVALSPLSAEAGEGMFVAQMIDVTARREAEERLTVQALQDNLTGLGNRALLRDRIELALRTLPDDGSGVAVLFCDLDDFKLVNDSAGHTSGDHALVEVAARLRSLLQPSDVAARLGGDEFVVLRPRTRTTEQAEDLATEVIETLAAPLVIGGQPYSLGVSIGIAWGTAGATADDLLRDADSAMYAAKADGKRRAVVFSDEHRARAMRAVRIEKELRRAVAQGELEMYLQPVVDLRDGTAIAAEALIRWRHPERGVLAPVEWLDVAETSGMMPEIGTWVLERSCELAQQWPAGPDGVVPAVHVNVSARQLDVPGFTDIVRDVLARTGLPPERLVLEFTETHLDDITELLLNDLVALRRTGIGLAADDYGTGYSPLTRIIELPISMIKVDRRFVSAMLDDVRSQAIVTTMVRLSESLGLALVAEGVETEAQADALRLLGCVAGQGYLWSRPVPADVFQARLVAAALVEPRLSRPVSG